MHRRTTRSVARWAEGPGRQSDFESDFELELFADSDLEPSEPLDEESLDEDEPSEDELSEDEPELSEPPFLPFRA